VLFFIQVSHELNNGLGRVPQMGKIKNITYLKKIIMQKHCRFNAIKIIAIFSTYIFRKRESEYHFSIEGWNSWNHFRCTINDTIVRQIADTFIVSGLAAVGYEYSTFVTYFFF